MFTTKPSLPTRRELTTVFWVGKCDGPKGEETNIQCNT